MKKITTFYNLTLSVVFLMVFGSLNFAFAISGRSTYQAKIFKPDGLPLEAPSVNFQFTVLDPSASCVLYVESYNAVSMSGGSGLISFSLGMGTRLFPVSGTSSTFANTFDNSVPMFNCQTLGTYNPMPDDSRKIVMQFNDGSGWQTLPAMSINAVPYSMFAGKSQNSQALNGKDDTSFVEYSTLASLSCAADQAIKFNGVSFSCITVGVSATPVTSSTVTAALGYTPVAGASFTSLDSTVSSVSNAVYSVSSTVTNLDNTVSTLSNSVAASFAAITSSQWTTSGTSILYNTGSVGIGTLTPATALDVSGGVRIGAETTTCAPALAGTLRYASGNVEYCNGVSWQAFGVSGAGITNFNGSTSGTQSFALGSGGTAPNFNTSNGVHTLNIPLASTGAVTAGLISNTDYTTFSNKITSSAASIAQVLGYVPADNSVSGTYAQKANNLSDLTNIVTARTNLGLGTFATASTIDLGGASATGTLAIARIPAFSGDATIAAASNTIVLSDTGVAAATYTKVTVDSKGRVTSGAQITSSDVTTALGYTPANSATMTSSQWSTSGTTINYMTGNVGIGTSSPTAQLHVVGAVSATSTMTAANFSISGGNGNPAVLKSYQDAGGNGSLYLGNLSGGSGTNGFNTVFNTIVGHGSYSSNSSGMANTVVGKSSYAMGASGSNNTFMGTFSGQRVIGDDNVLLGAYAGQGATGSNITGNIIIGRGAGNAITTGAYNTIIGTQAASNSISSGSYNILIGYQTGLPVSNTSNYLNIGNVIYGQLSTGQIGIGTAAPTARLHLASGTSSLAPLRFVAGTLTSTPASGTIEYDGTNFYYTDDSLTRRAFGSASTSSLDGISTISNASGTIALVPNGAVVVSSTTASTSSNNGALVVKGGLGVGGTTNIGGNLNVSGSTTFDGSLGIGVSSSVRPLHVRSAANGVIRIDRASSMPAVEFNRYSAADFSTLWSTWQVGADATSSDSRTFQIADSSPSLGTQIVRFAIDQNGNVGIGTTSATSKLTVAASSGTAQTITQTGATGYGLTIIPGADSTYDALTINNAANTVNRHRFLGGGDVYLSMGGGSVGIGTSTPSGVLQTHVNANGDTRNYTYISAGSDIARLIMYGPDADVRPNEFWLDAYTAGTSLILSTNNTERVRVDPTGNVGIGTTAPGAKLHIASPGDGILKEGLILSNGFTPGFKAGEGSSIIFRDTNASNDMAGVGGGSLQTNNGSHGFLSFSTRGNSPSEGLWERMRIIDDGNVGIGTTTPGTKLDVAGSIRAGASTSGNVTISNDGNALIELRESDNSGTPYIDFANDAATDYDFRFILNGDDAMSIMGGNVGVGTSNPADIFSVYTSNGFGWQSGFKSFSASPDAGGIFYTTDNSGWKFHIGKQVSGTYTKQMTLQDNGNVGIGTINPLTSLHVSGTATFQNPTGSSYNENIRLPAANNDYASIALGSSATAAAGTMAGQWTLVRFPSAVHNNLFTIRGNSTDHFAITASGSVGIGTNSPAAKLDVAGEVKFGNTSSTCNSTNEGQQRYNGTSKAMEFCNGTAWTAYSSGSGGRTSCPAGFTLIGTSGSAEAFCISTAQEAAATWVGAATACYNKSTKARLCSTSEWVMACVAGASGPNNMTGTGSEWVADLDSDRGTVMGISSCSTALNDLVSESYGSRCCFR